MDTTVIIAPTSIHEYIASSSCEAHYINHTQAKPDFNTKVSMANLKVWDYHNFVNIFV
jgi:hypothetical protein